MSPVWLLLVLGCPRPSSTPASEAAPPAPVADTTPESTVPASYTVYDGEQLVLTVTDTPGPLRSTAMLPPGIQPASHPFLSGQAHSASHEPMLREALDAASSTEGFLEALSAQGLRVESVE